MTAPDGSGSRASPTIIQVGDTAGVPQRLAAGLRDCGYPVISVIPPAPLASAPLALKLASLPKRLHWGRSLIRSWRSLPCPILHVHYATAAIPLLRSGLPLVVHAHGSDVRSASRAQRAALAAVWRESALRIVATPDLLTDVPGSVYLPNPIDVERFQQIGDLVPDRDVLVFAALTSIKGADVLVDAVRLIKSQRPDCTVTALAGGPFESAMYEAGAVISDRVTASELPAFIGRHRVVLGQQFLGALGVADLEAMATARPVVMNLRTDLAYESVPPIVNAGDAQSIASATSALLDDPNMSASIGSSCSRWVDQYHRTDRVVEQLLAMYAAALPGKF